MSKDKKKTVYIDSDSCIGCTLCTQICPGFFEMDDEGKSRVNKSGKCSNDKIDQAIDACPVACLGWKAD